MLPINKKIQFFNDNYWYRQNKSGASNTLYRIWLMRPILRKCRTFSICLKLSDRLPESKFCEFPREYMIGSPWYLEKPTNSIVLIQNGHFQGNLRLFKGLTVELFTFILINNFIPQRHLLEKL